MKVWFFHYAYEEILPTLSNEGASSWSLDLLEIADKFPQIRVYPAF